MGLGQGQDGPGSAGPVEQQEGSEGETLPLTLPQEGGDSLWGREGGGTSQAGTRGLGLLAAGAAPGPASPQAPQHTDCLRDPRGLCAGTAGEMLDQRLQGRHAPEGPFCKVRSQSRVPPRIPAHSPTQRVGRAPKPRLQPAPWTRPYPHPLSPPARAPDACSPSLPPTLPPSGGPGSPIRPCLNVSSGLSWLSRHWVQAPEGVTQGTWESRALRETRMLSSLQTLGNSPAKPTGI